MGPGQIEPGDYRSNHNCEDSIQPPDRGLRFHLLGGDSYCDVRSVCLPSTVRDDQLDGVDTSSQLMIERAGITPYYLTIYGPFERDRSLLVVVAPPGVELDLKPGFVFLRPCWRRYDCSGWEINGKLDLLGE